jgi:hypothetical protein
MIKLKNMVKKAKDDAELIELGKKLQAFYDSGYVNRKQVLWFSLLKGLLSGVGATIGGILIIILLLWILTFVRNIPGLGPVAQNIRTTIQSHSAK